MDPFPWMNIVSNNYGLVMMTFTPRIVVVIHTDNSIESSITTNPAGLDKMAFTLTGDMGCEFGDGVSCHNSRSWSIRNRVSSGSWPITSCGFIRTCSVYRWRRHDQQSGTLSGADPADQWRNSGIGREQFSILYVQPWGSIESLGYVGTFDYMPNSGLLYASKAISAMRMCRIGLEPEELHRRPSLAEVLDE